MVHLVPNPINYITRHVAELVCSTKTSLNYEIIEVLRKGSSTLPVLVVYQPGSVREALK